MASKLYPSSADRWCACLSSPYMESLVPRQPSGPDAMEGTAVHALSDWLIKNRITPDPDMVGKVCIMMDIPTGKAKGVHVPTGCPAEWTKHSIGLLAGAVDSWPVTDKWIEAASLYTSLVERIRIARPKAEVLTEQYLAYRPGVIGGFADCIIADHEAQWFAVIDYKNGRGPVTAEENKQMAIYARAWMQTGQKGAQKVVCAIVQPHAGDSLPPIRVWQTTCAAIASLCDDIDDAADQALAVFDAPETAEGLCMMGDHCRWCNAKTICPAVKREALAVLPPLEVAIAPPPVSEMTDDQIGAVMARVGMARMWLDAVEADVTARLHGGREIPGWKLVEGRSARQIKDPEALIALAEVNDWPATQKKLRPLSELEKVLPKGELDKHTVKPPGKPTLAPADDKRPAIVTKTALLEGL